MIHFEKNIVLLPVVLSLLSWHFSSKSKVSFNWHYHFQILNLFDDNLPLNYFYEVFDPVCILGRISCFLARFLKLKANLVNRFQLEYLKWEKIYYIVETRSLTPKILPFFSPSIDLKQRSSFSYCWMKMKARKIGTIISNPKKNIFIAWPLIYDSAYLENVTQWNYLTLYIFSQQRLIFKNFVWKWVGGS